MSSASAGTSSNDQKTRSSKKQDDNVPALVAQAAVGVGESQPLLAVKNATNNNYNPNQRFLDNNSSKALSAGFIRARRSSKSPVVAPAVPHQSRNLHFTNNSNINSNTNTAMIRVRSGQGETSAMNSNSNATSTSNTATHATATANGYEPVDDATFSSQRSNTANNSSSSNSNNNTDTASQNSNRQYSQHLADGQQQQQQQQRSSRQGGSYSRGSQQQDDRSVGSTASGSEQPPLLEIPEEIYAVRKAALQVLKPLTKTWIVVSVGFALTVLFGMTRWTRLLPGIPFWFILLPCWSTHIGLLWLHVLSAKALSTFIANANDSRQRADSRDHLNRTEYLPLLQRSLKFGLKTGILSFCVFIFEILIYIRLAVGSISLTVAFVPLWLLVSAGVVDGLVCKSQHFLRVICWMLTFSAMVLIVMKVDYGYNNIRWRTVMSPIIAVLSIASATLIYIVYGHQVGYYRLTESQLTAGNLYALAALICIVLVVMIGEVIPLTRPVEVETRMFVVILAPLVACLVGMGAWVVSRDEFGRLLLFGGQSTVHPMKLRWESKGWTSVQGKGVTVIPMFGEVFYRPLERKPSEHIVELCTCCQGACYPYADEDEEAIQVGADGAVDHPYLDPNPARSARPLGNSYNVLRGGTS